MVAVGGLLAPALTTSAKTSLALKLPSLAVTLTLIVPTLATAGVPETARVVGLKLSQFGSVAPVSRVAL